MSVPENLTPIVDADLLVYEIAFGSETGWKALTNTEDLPPWDYVAQMLHNRLDAICREVKTDKAPVLYLTEGKTFRYDVAKKKPYKAGRKLEKPWHFRNLMVYIRDVLGAKVATGIEADDLMSIDHLASGGTTILCSRDKDLRQIPGYMFSWELSRQPSFGPTNLPPDGMLYLNDKGELRGFGLSWFYAQVLTGDTIDNYGGCPGIGPKKAFQLLAGLQPEEQLEAVIQAYKDVYGDETWEEELLEQGRLAWILRKPDQVWEIGVTE